MKADSSHLTMGEPRHSQQNRIDACRAGIEDAVHRTDAPFPR